MPKRSAYVSVTEDGTIRFSSGVEKSVIVPGPAEVGRFAASVVASEPDKVFVLKAEADTRYELVEQVVDALKQAKVKSIYMLSGAEGRVEHTPQPGTVAPPRR